MMNDEFDSDLWIPHNAHESNDYSNLSVLKAQIVRVIPYRMEQTQWQKPDVIRHHQRRPLRSLVAPVCEPTLTYCDIHRAWSTIHFGFYPKTTTASSLSRPPGRPARP